MMAPSVLGFGVLGTYQLRRKTFPAEPIPSQFSGLPSPHALPTLPPHPSLSGLACLVFVALEPLFVCISAPRIAAACLQQFTSRRASVPPSDFAYIASRRCGPPQRSCGKCPVFRGRSEVSRESSGSLRDVGTRLGRARCINTVGNGSCLLGKGERKGQV